MVELEPMQYDPYQDGGFEWLDTLPEHWGLRRLKELSNIQNSNVDKKSYENEMAVQLCNYVDVYKNEFISASINFMWATADESEIKRFSIKENDVLITKDSETSDDIAVPALVKQSITGVLCGYHLAQIKTKSKILNGAYLFRLFQSMNYGFRFVISAKGITRVGLGQSAIADALTPIPPIHEQITIANYLDSKTAQIDCKINLLSQKAEHYRKLKQSLINETVTRGLDKTVALKDSGVEWIGEVPVHWQIKRIKEVSDINKNTLSESTSANYEFNYVDIGSVTYGVKEFVKEPMTFSAAPSRAKRIVKKGDTIVSTVRTYLKAIASIDDDVFDLIVSTGFAVISPKRKITYKYCSYLLTSDFLINEICALSTGVSYPATNATVIGNLFFLVPPQDEQQAIAKYLDEKTAKIDQIVTAINAQIDKLKELRKILINDVVTGKIKVA